MLCFCPSLVRACVFLLKGISNSIRMLYRMQFAVGPPTRAASSSADNDEQSLDSSPEESGPWKEDITEADFMFLYNQGAAAGPGGAMGEIGQVTCASLATHSQRASS